MAFMMPVVKKNYALYASPGTSNGNAVDPRQRRISDQVDGHGNRRVASAGQAGRPRKAKSEGQSLSTSPGGILIGHNANRNAGSSDIRIARSIPVDMVPRRSRTSAPILMPGTLHSSSLQHSSHFGKKLAVPSTSAPTGDCPLQNDPSSHSRSSISSSSTSSSDSAAVGKGFHSKLVMRLRKTLRIKDTEPGST